MIASKSVARNLLATTCLAFVVMLACPLLAFAQDNADETSLTAGSVDFGAPQQDLSAQDVSPTNYTYEVRPLIAPFNNVIYVKTNNPDPTSFRLTDYQSTILDEAAYGYPIFELIDQKLLDVHYENESTFRVPGGYLFYDAYGLSDGGQLTLQARLPYDPIHFGDTNVTVSCPTLMNAESYLIATYAAGKTGLFDKLDAVQSGLASLAVYPRTVTDTTEQLGYPLWAASPYKENSLNPHYEIYGKSENGLLIRLAYPFVRDSASFPTTMSKIAKKLDPTCTVTNYAGNHSRINVTKDGRTESYGGYGSGQPGSLYTSKATIDFFTGGAGDLAASSDLPALKARYLKYVTDTNAEVEALKVNLEGAGFKSAVGPGCWMHIAVEAGWEPTAYAYAALGPTGYMPVFLSDAWVDGRYINEYERYVAGAKFSDHSTAAIVVRNQSFKDKGGRQRVSDIVYQYDSASGCWLAGDYYRSAYTGVPISQINNDLFILTPEEVAAMNVDGNTDRTPDAGKIYDGTAEPGTPFLTTHVQGITMQSSLTLVLGESKRLPYTVTPANASDQKVNWSSTNRDIVSPDEGYMTTRGLGTATVTASTRDGKHVATCKVTVVAPIDIGSATFSTVGNQEYTGSQIKPALTITYGGKKLAEGTDYELAYWDNKAVGKGTIVVNGKGKYNGSKTITFDIVCASIANAKVEVESPVAYSHFGYSPSVQVKLGSKVLSEYTDYTVEDISRDYGVGTATVVVTGRGNYTGTATGTFQIVLSEITGVWLHRPEWEYYANGSEQKAEVFVRGECRDVLTEGVDYDLFYTPCIEPGEVTVTARGKGNYTGEKSVSYTIQPGFWTDQQQRQQRQPKPSKKTAPTAWKRLSGNTALDTMRAIVREGFTAKGGTVVVATFDGYWDALAAAGLAGLSGAPVLMTDGSALSAQTQSELERLAPRQVFVCGGPAAVSDGACAQIAGVCGVEPQRIYGATAVDTAAQINLRAPAVTGGAWSGEAFLCTSDGYWDALAAAPVAYALNMPIFLTEADGTLSASTLDAIRACGVTKVHIAGGKAAVSESAEGILGNLMGKRFAGDVAIQTSEAIARFGLSRGMTADNMGVATTEGYWDALAGAALCGKKSSVLVLVGDASSSSIGGFVAENSASEVSAYVFGGPAAVGDDVVASLGAVTTDY